MHTNPTDGQLRTLLAGTRTIAVVGASSKPDRPSNEIMNILIRAGFRVIPVTPNEKTVLGRDAYPSLAEIPERVDIVDVFRRAEDTPPIAEDAVKIGAKALWLQLGITNDEAAGVAEAAGLTTVMNRCIGQTVLRLGIKSMYPDEVTEASMESFPASDPPAWNTLRAGDPERD